YGQEAGAQEQVLLALGNGIGGHVDVHPAHLIVAGGCLGSRLEQKGVVQEDFLSADWRPKKQLTIHRLGGGRARMSQQSILAIKHFHIAHMRRTQSGPEKAVEYRHVAGDDAIFYCWGQLVSDQLASV